MIPVGCWSSLRVILGPDTPIYHGWWFGSPLQSLTRGPLSRSHERGELTIPSAVLLECGVALAAECRVVLVHVFAALADCRSAPFRALPGE